MYLAMGAGNLKGFVGPLSDTKLCYKRVLCALGEQAKDGNDSCKNKKYGLNTDEHLMMRI